MTTTKEYNFAKLIKIFILTCLVFSFSAMAQITADKPMEAKALANMIKEFKEIVSKNSPDKNEAKLVIEKWDKRTDLAGKTKSEVIELLYEDVKAVIKDSGTQYQIYSIFSFYKNVDIDENKPQAVLNTEFRFENCESLMAQFDSFSVSMQNDPNAMGYIILNGKQRTRTNTAQQIREYIKMRRLDFNRYMFLNGDGDSPVVIEFWLVPNGAELPAPKKVVDETSEKFEMPTEPFVYTEKFSYAAFGCTTPLDVEGYASILDEYPKSRSNIVIYERSQRIFRQKEKEILAQLTKRGIARKRLKTFFKLVDSEAPNEGIKLWILP